jgi:hypothetical protein
MDALAPSASVAVVDRTAFLRRVRHGDGAPGSSPQLELRAITARTTTIPGTSVGSDPYVKVESPNVLHQMRPRIARG